MADGTELPDVVALFYHADWTTLSLSASAHGLVDDSLRFRMQQAGAGSLAPWVKLPVPSPPPELGVREFRATLRVAGGRYWVEGSARKGPQSGRQSQVRKLLWPRGLLTAWGLEVTEQLTVFGRPALRVVAAPRPGVWRASRTDRQERIEVIADAATGILLRREDFYEGQTLELTELTEAVFGPEAGDFEVPPAAETDQQERDPFGEPPPFVPDWQVKAAKGAANLLGTGLTAGLRHASRQHSDVTWEMATEDDDEPEIPAVEELADRAATGEPVSDEVLHALHRSGSATFTATLHEWYDNAAWGERMRSAAASHGLSGLGSLPGELGELVGTTHQRTRVAIGSEGRYRLDFPGSRASTRPTTITCDGSRLWRQYADRVTVSPAIALADEFNAPGRLAELIDTSGLLRHAISEVAETEFNGRRVVVLRLLPPPKRTPADLPVDAELGILLRQLSYSDGKINRRSELRDVAPLAPGEEGDLFDFTVPAGVRVVETDGGRLGEIEVPESVLSAVRSAGSAAKAARSFLESLRGRQQD